VGRTINNKFQYFIGFIIAVLMLAGCKEESDLGIEILPKDDLITVHNTVVKEAIASFTFTDDSVRTINSSSSLLGNLVDPVFGETVINYAAQFRLQSFPDFGDNPEPDSIKLILRYRNVYGDTVTPQMFRVYELQSDLDADGEYYQDVDLKSMASDFLLGEVSYLPIIETDTTSRGEVYLKQQIISVPLDISLGTKLLSADSLQLVNNDVFLEFFKGLYIESEKAGGEGGSILTLDELTSSDNLGSGLVLYYDNEENSNSTEPDTMFLPLLVSEFSARVNSIEHDYSNTAFEEYLDSEEEEDSLVYIQATGGLKSRILIDDLETWKDSINTAINKAELIFEVDTIASDIENFFPPTQLLFTVVDEDGNEFLPIDYVFDPDYYGGALREDFTYRFNITQHLQEIINESADNFGFYLTPANKNNEASRVVLKGSKSNAGVKLVITYSKFTI